MFVVYVLALKQTQAVDPQIKAETEAEASTESPEPVSIEAVQSRCEGVCKNSTPFPYSRALGKESRRFASLWADLTLWAECVVQLLSQQ